MEAFIGNPNQRARSKSPVRTGGEVRGSRSRSHPNLRVPVRVRVARWWPDEQATPRSQGSSSCLTCLTLVHVIEISIDGASVDPARILGPALFAANTARSHLWAVSPQRPPHWLRSGRAIGVPVVFDGDNSHDPSVLVDPVAHSVLTTPCSPLAEERRIKPVPHPVGGSPRARRR